MLTRTIEYIDFNGTKRKRVFFFNLTQAEISEMELSVSGGLERMIKKIAEEEDGEKLVTLFKDLILRSYGEKSADGDRFVKNEELRTGFSQTQAYSDLFMELATNADAAAAFFNGIIPELPDDEPEKAPKE